MTTTIGTPGGDVTAEAQAAVRSHIRGSGLLLGGRIISFGLTVLTQTLIVRHLSTRDYSAWAYAFSAVLLLQVLSGFGSQEAVPRFVSIYHERRDFARMFGTMVLSVGLIALSSALVIAAYFYFPDKLLALLHQERESLAVLSVLIFMVPLEGFDGILMGIFASLASPQSIFFRRYVVAPALKLAVVLLLIAVKAPVLFLAYGFLASSVLGMAIYTWILIRHLHKEGLLTDLRRDGIRIPYRELLSFVAPMMTSDLLLVLNDSVLVLLVGYYSGLRAAALLRMVIPVAAMNHIVGNMTGILYMPAAARLFANHDREGLTFVLAHGDMGRGAQLPGPGCDVCFRAAAHHRFVWEPLCRCRDDTRDHLGRQLFPGDVGIQRHDIESAQQSPSRCGLQSFDRCRNRDARTDPDSTVRCAWGSGYLCFRVDCFSASQTGGAQACRRY